MPFFDSTKPLGLPAGSIRAIIALSVIGLTAYSYLNGINSEALAALSGAIITFYFKTRTDQEASK